MDFNFEYHHLAMDSREKIQAIKIIQSVHPTLIDIIIRELKAGNVVTRAQTFGEQEIEVALRHSFQEIYSHPELQHVRETDPHYSGDFYRIGSHAVVAPFFLTELNEAFR